MIDARLFLFPVKWGHSALHDRHNSSGLLEGGVWGAKYAELLCFFRVSSPGCPLGSRAVLVLQC